MFSLMSLNARIICNYETRASKYICAKSIMILQIVITIWRHYTVYSIITFKYLVGGYLLAHLISCAAHEAAAANSSFVACIPSSLIPFSVTLQLLHQIKAQKPSYRNIVIDYKLAQAL